MNESRSITERTPMTALNLEPGSSQASDQRALVELELGKLGRASVLACPAQLLTGDEWRTIVTARESYQMWGSGEEFEAIDEDAFDGRGQFASCYTTTHYIGRISTPGKRDKIITMRKVAPVLNGAVCPLIEDLGFWTVRDSTTHTVVPLADVVRDYLGRSKGWPFVAPTLPIAGLSRGATMPIESGTPRDVDDRNRSAVVYALIQVAAAQHDHTHVFYAGQICPEFRTKAFALHLRDRASVELDLPPALHTLGLSEDTHRVLLDRGSPTVVGVMRSAPGFWLDNSSLADALCSLIEERELSLGDLRRAAATMSSSDDTRFVSGPEAAAIRRLEDGAQLSTVEAHCVASLLARPKNAKHIVDTLRQRSDIWQYVMKTVLDGPYVFLVQPAALLQSALHLLQIAREVYS
jgi:hypothetical protein